MPRCPQCTKVLPELSRRCPFCMADLDLLVDYVTDLQSATERAERYTRAGELGLAVWSYLEVLEVDPDNAQARRQVGQVATAVRQFDRLAPGRRWHLGQGEGSGTDFANTLRVSLRVGLVVLAILIAFLLGLSWRVPSDSSGPAPELQKPGSNAQPAGG